MSTFWLFFKNPVNFQKCNCVRSGDGPRERRRHIPRENMPVQCWLDGCMGVHPNTVGYDITLLHPKNSLSKLHVSIKESLTIRMVNCLGDSRAALTWVIFFSTTKKDVKKKINAPTEMALVQNGIEMHICSKILLVSLLKSGKEKQWSVNNLTTMVFFQMFG